MDDRRFDALAVALATGRSRRALSRLLAGGALVGLLGRGRAGAAPRKRRGHYCPPETVDCGGEFGPCCGSAGSCCYDQCCDAFNSLCYRVPSGGGHCCPAETVLCGDWGEGHGPGCCRPDVVCCALRGGNLCCPQGSECPEDAYGACRCPEGHLVCGDPPACADLGSDPNHCGACELSCAEGQACCDGACVDTTRDRNHCGACGNRCGREAECVDGRCACRPGGALCGDVCCGGPYFCDLETLSCENSCDLERRAACGKFFGGKGMFCCPAGQQCLSEATGECGPCRPEQHICLGQCCDQPCCGEILCCAPDEECSKGRCCPRGKTTCEECKPGTSRCRLTCVDLRSSERHCGRCGRECKKGQVCRRGRCR